MKQKKQPAIIPQPRSLLQTAKHAARHAVVFGTITIIGHVLSASLATSAGALGAGIYPAVIGGMIMM